VTPVAYGLPCAVGRTNINLCRGNTVTLGRSVWSTDLDCRNVPTAVHKGYIWAHVLTATLYYLRAITMHVWIPTQADGATVSDNETQGG